MMPTGDQLTPHIDLVRLRAEAALVRRLNAGHGFADSRAPADVYLRNEQARERLSRDALKPHDTHLDQESEIAEAIAECEAALGTHESPLSNLFDRFNLDAPERALLSTAVAYQLDSDVRALCDALAGSRSGALYGDVCQDIAIELADPRTLLRVLHPSSVLRAGLLINATQTDLLVGAEITATARAVHWLLGDYRVSGDVAGVVSLYEADFDPAVYLDDEVRRAVDEIAKHVRDTDEKSLAQPLVLIQGPQGCGKQAVAHALAAALGRPLAVAALPGIMEAERRGNRGFINRVLAEVRLRHAVAYLPGVQPLTAEDARDVRPTITQAMQAYGDLLVLSTREPGIPSVAVERPFHLVSLPRPTLETRRTAWTRGLEMLGDNVDLADDAGAGLGSRYVIGPGTIGGVLHEAQSFALATGEPVRLAGIEQAVGRRLTLRIGAFGSLVTRSATFEQMVLPEDVIDTLRDMVVMVRERARILETWGYAKHLGISRGVSALFSGEPGTGKTMAASVIAGELGLELVRVDLSSVVSKWVGETEKHLAKIFDEAQNANAMLVFDEADSLFGKRTEVKSAQDRFANMEVNYVLQRMETFDGICILTSNMEASIDPAFQRRLNFRVRFPKPEVEERVQLWQKLVPPEAGLEGVDFAPLAKTFEMTGGHIKNAIVRAAVIAARQDRRVEPQDLVAGAHVEYLELGKVMPELPTL